MSTPDLTPDQMEEVPCPICAVPGKPSWIAQDKVHSAPGDYPILECVSCGHHWISPRPKESLVVRKQAKTRGRLSIAHLREKAALLKVQEGRITILASMTPPGGTVLDVGSGDGYFLSSANRAGYKAIGLERDENRCSAQGYEFGVLSLPQGPTAQPNWPIATASMDAVTLWNSLETAHHPGVLLQEAYRVLKPGGSVIVCVPNYRSWERRFFKSFWFELQPLDHLSQFSPGSLKTLLQKTGFSLGPVWCASTATGVTMSWRALRGRPLDQPGPKRGEVQWFFKTLWLTSMLQPALKLADSLGFGGTLLALARKPEV